MNHKTIYILLITILSVMRIHGQTDNYFYYAFQEKVYLDPIPNKFVIEFINTPDETILNNNNLYPSKITQKIYEVTGNITQIQNIWSRNLQCKSVVQNK